YSSSSVEQIGTDSDIANGVPTYYAWYEMYPNPFSKIYTVPVKPGDVIAASVSYTGSDNFHLVISNTTAGQSFSIDKLASGVQRSSAEWIAEAPSSISGVLPLTNFGTVNF